MSHSDTVTSQVTMLAPLPTERQDLKTARGISSMTSGSAMVRVHSYASVSRRIWPRFGSSGMQIQGSAKGGRFFAEVERNENKNSCDKIRKLNKTCG
jgi:hypothetical protein